jgi:hypothetical protein
MQQPTSLPLIQTTRVCWWVRCYSNEIWSVNTQQKVVTHSNKSDTSGQSNISCVFLILLLSCECWPKFILNIYIFMSRHVLLEMTGRQRFHFQYGAWIHLFAPSSRQCLRTTHRPTNSVPRIHPPGVKRPKRETVRSRPTSG